MATMRSSSGGFGCLYVGGGLFAAIGAGVGCYLGTLLLAWHSMQGWVEVPARIEKAELVTHSGEDGSTYSLDVRYTYEYEGRSYTGTRAALHGGADNIGSYHQQKYGELEAYRGSEEPFRCYVNPARPSESVLFRDPRWELMIFLGVFVFVFGGAGLAAIGGGVFGRRNARATEALHAQWPAAPWMWRQPWVEGRIEYRASAAAFGLGVFAALWNSIALPAWYLAYSEGVFSESLFAGIMISLFPAVGLFLVFGAIRAALQWRKYGCSVFRMAEVPGVIGGTLRGVIEVPARVSAEQGYHLKLSCIHRVTTGTGKNRHTREDTVWKDERVIARELLAQDSSLTVLPVLFGIPFDMPDFDESDSNNAIIWRLEVQAATPGVDYEAKFEVPVFKTDTSSPDFVLDESALTGYVNPSQPN